MYNAIIAKIYNVRSIDGADRIKQANCLSNSCVVGLDAQEGELGVWFDGDGQLSWEYCEVNDLIGYKDEQGNKKGRIV